MGKVAPEELPLVEGLVQFDDGVVVRRLGRRRGRREPLGFGADEAATLVTAAAWLALDRAARELAEDAGDGAAKGVKAVLRRLWRRRTPPAVVPPLTREQLGEVHRQVLETAARQGLSRARGEAIADAVVSRLALVEPGASAHGTRA